MSLDRDPIREEMEHHLDELEEMLVREGMSRDEARAEARRRFGSVERWRRSAAEAGGRDPDTGDRGTVLDALAHETGQALRTLRRAPGFAALVVAILALGLGANTAIFSVVHGVLLRPLGVEEPERVVVIREANPETGVESSPTSRASLEDWRTRVDALASVAGWEWRSWTLEDPDDPAELTGVLVTGSFFSTLGVEPALGRPLTEADVVPDGPGATAVVSHRVWSERFGRDPGVLGRTIRLDGRPVEVVGVMPPAHVAPDPDADLWIASSLRADGVENRGNRWTHAAARLAPGATREQAEARVRALAATIARDYPTRAAGWTARLVPLRELVLGDVRTPLLVAFGAVGLLLLIACVNVANLLLARAARRRPELAMRMALGASGRRVGAQLLAESVILALAGGAGGVAVAYGLRPLILALEPGLLPRTGEVAIDLPVLGFALVAALATGILFGLLPALRVARGDLAGFLREGGGRGAVGGGGRLRAGLVVAQLGLAVVLLTGAGLLVRTFAELRAVDPGYDPEGVAAARVFLDAEYRDGDRLRTYMRELLAGVRALPGVEEAGIASALPMDPVAVSYDLPFQTESLAGTPDDELPQADFRLITPGYMEALGFRLLRGRLFRETDDADAPPVILVNRTMAERYWPDGSPVGRPLSTVGNRGWQEFEVVGVVEDTRYYGPAEPPRPEMYVSLLQVPRTGFAVVARTVGDAEMLLPALEEAVVRVDPLQPPQSLITAAALVEDELATERFYATVLAAFALLALALAAAGIYGVLAYWVSQRGREIGVRMALGASRGEVVRLVVRQGMATAGLGMGAGLLAAAALTRVLEGMLFGVRPLDPLTYAAVPLFLGAVALLASWVPARRAGRLDPMAVLREE